MSRRSAISEPENPHPTVGRSANVGPRREREDGGMGPTYPTLSSISSARNRLNGRAQVNPGDTAFRTWNDPSSPS